MINKHYCYIPAIYFVVSILYIYTSDKALLLLMHDENLLSVVSMSKGFIFVSITAILLYYLIKRALEKEVSKEKEKQRFLIANVGAMNHIMAKFVSKMAIIRSYAERRNDFDTDVLRLFDEIVTETKLEINRISEIENLSDSAIYEIIHQIKK